MRKANATKRICIVFDLDLGNVEDLNKCWKELEVKITNRMSRKWGKRVYFVFDLEWTSKEKNLFDFPPKLRALPGVRSCEIGHFTYGLDKADSERVCIVHRNQVNVVENILKELIKLNVKVLSQLTQIRDRFGYTIIDIESCDSDLYDRICDKVSSMSPILSCDLKNFSPSSLPKSTALSPNSERNSAEFSEYDNDSGYETEDETEFDMVEIIRKHAEAIGPMETPEEAPSSPIKSDLNGNDYYSYGCETSNVITKHHLAMRERNSLTKAHSKKLVIAMVGLPCRGKSFTARKLCQFFNWKGMQAKIFNAGKYRRDQKILGGSDSHFFSSASKAGSDARESAASEALKDLLNYLEGGGDVAIFDATNSVKSRREKVVEQCAAIAKVVFLEVVCDDGALVEENYIIKVRSSPDYSGVSEIDALADLRARVANYEQVYETVEESENCSFIKIYNISSKVLTKGVYGRLTRSVVPYLTALHVGTRSVLLVRAGLAKNAGFHKSAIKPSGASLVSPLSQKGLCFARRLSLWLKTMLFMRTSDGRPRTDSNEKVRLGDGNVNLDADLKVMSSTLPRAVETANIAIRSLNSSNEVEPMPMLNPLNKGKFFGLSNDELRKKHPEFWGEFLKNPLYARFPNGESYHDIITKLESVIVDIEQQTAPVLVVAHISTLQMLMAYFKNIPIRDAVSIEIPMHSVIELKPLSGGSWKDTVYNLEPL